MEEDKIVNTISGYANGEEKAVEKFEIEFDDIPDIMLNAGYDKCPCCEWWVELWELIPIDEDEPDGYCENCR